MAGQAPKAEIEVRPSDDGKSTFQYIKPPNFLKAKVKTEGMGNGLDMEAIARAEKALEALSVNFDGWMQADVKKMVELRERINQSGLTEALSDELFHAAHDMKGQAATFGYPNVSMICASLSKIVETSPDKSRVPGILISQHIDAIRAIVKEGQTSEKSATAKALAQRLITVSAEFVKNELVRARKLQATAAA